MLSKLKEKVETGFPALPCALVSTLYSHLHPQRKGFLVAPLKNSWVLNWKGHRFLLPREEKDNSTPRYFTEVYNDYCNGDFNVERGDVVVDVGAWVGAFTVSSAWKAGPKGRVIAIEPDPRNFIYLKKNTSQLQNVLCLQMALWDERGRKKLFHGPSTLQHSLLAHGRGYTWVRTDTLDGLLSRLRSKEIGFIKMDVEGAELEILRGWREYHHVKRIAVAAYHCREGKPTWPTVKKMLEERGFRVQVTDKHLVRGWKE